MPRRALRALPPLFVFLLALALLNTAPASAAGAPPSPRPQPPVAAADAAPAPIVITGVLALRDQPLTPGTRAIVQADGSCLRLRDGAGTNATVLTCLAEGTSVLVMPSVEADDNYRWQFVLAGSLLGWVADEFLIAEGERAACGAPNAATAAVRPGISGELPATGVGAVLWGGGTTNGVVTQALLRGCHANSIWAQREATGALVGYLTRVPSWVNRDWQAQYGGGIPPGTILFVVCGEPTQATVPIVLSSAGAPTLLGGAPAPKIAGLSGVVIDAASGAVLYEHDAHLRLAPASLTKMATAVVAIEGADIGQWVVNDSVDYRAMPGSSVMGLRPGDCFSLRDLIYGLMLPSGNDAGLAIARYVAGRDDDFVRGMNMLAARLGLQDTAFIDPHGLGGQGHYSSAYDLAMIARYGMTLPLFGEVVSAKSWTAQGSRPLALRTLNKFLTSYPGADGLKTGFTEEAGRTLAVSATRDGHRLIAVLLNDADRFPDAQGLLDWAFENYRWP
ncbi:MAG: D-alanyl-D-alanine carboxypeptidase family protein [Dehalococcoidia bacterium]